MQTRFLLLCACLCILLQAVCCCSAIGGPRPPYTITPSEGALTRLRERWQQSIQASPDGSVSLTVTEEEMTALVTELLAGQEDLPLSDPQVFLRDGRIEVYAMVEQGNTASLPGMVALSVTSADGEIEISVEEAQLGPFPVPPATLEEATRALNEALEQGLTAELGNVTVTDIQISDREMSISGIVAP
ncbi:MAG: hypothetical protein N2508_12835 [Anaerolineae bacterium]|nr:hypothetical protein [Anaerolineae bacterium]